MPVIVGLGNPGAQYARTRHNAGFDAVRRLADRQRARWDAWKADGRAIAQRARVTLAGSEVILLLPQLFMNLSGEALKAGAIAPGEVLIVCDDVDLPLGAVRLRPGGGASGHNGLASCLQALGTQDVARLRLGVGHGGPRPSPLEQFVLEPFAAQERPAVEEMLEQAASACEVWVSEGIEAAMNRYNQKVQDA